jgi:hypothetical protein
MIVPSLRDSGSEFSSLRHLTSRAYRMPLLLFWLSTRFPSYGMLSPQEHCWPLNFVDEIRQGRARRRHGSRYQRWSSCDHFLFFPHTALPLNSFTSGSSANRNILAHHSLTNNTRVGLSVSQLPPVFSQSGVLPFAPKLATRVCIKAGWLQILRPSWLRSMPQVIEGVVPVASGLLSPFSNSPQNVNGPYLATDTP